MRFVVNKHILTRYSNLTVAVIICKGMDNSGESKDVDKLLKDVEELIKREQVPDVSKHQLISPWRAVYSDFGAKPSKYHCSVEALMRRALKGSIPRINKLVDLYNYFSLKHLVPMGADDLDKVKGDIKLVLAKGTEKFVPFGGESGNPDKGEVIYKDDKGVLCRRWNWRESATTKIDLDTKNAIIYIEGLFPVTKEKVEEIANDFISLAEVSLKGSYKYFILDKKKSEVEF